MITIDFPHRNKNLPLQRLNAPSHNLRPHTQHLHPHLLHPFQHPHGANVRHRALVRHELARAGRFEADVGVFAARVGTGAGGEEGGFDGGEGGVRGCEGEFVAGLRCRGGHCWRGTWVKMEGIDVGGIETVEER